MPYRPKKYTKEPQPRFLNQNDFRSYYAQPHIEELKKQTLISDADNKPFLLKMLTTKSFAPMNDLGWKLEEGNRVPKDPGGLSRMYLVRQDKDGRDTLMAYDGQQLSDGTKLEMKSTEFWEQIQMGNVIAFPLGDTKPVQLQISGFDIEFSKPLEPSQIPMRDPEPPVPARPNGWKRFWHGIFKSAYKKDFEEYDVKMAPHKEWEKKRSALNADLENLSKQRESYSANEVALAEKQKAEAKEKERIESLQRELDLAKDALDLLDLGQKNSQAIYEPVPTIFETEETKKLYPGRTAPGAFYNNLLHRNLPKKDGEQKQSFTYGFYTTEQFGDLTVLDKDQLDLEKIPVGTSGRSVTREEYCAVAMFAAMNPEYAKNVRGQLSEYNDKLEQDLSTLGVKEDKLDTIMTGYSMLYTQDTFYKHPRDRSGEYIKNGIDPARKAAMDAFNAYKNGDTKPLGKLLAQGVNDMAGQLAGMDLYGDQLSGISISSARLLELMEADPALKNAAVDAGMTGKNLAAVEGLREFCALDKEAKKANVKLAQAALDGTKLTPEEKQACAKAIVKARIACETIILENANHTSPFKEKMHLALSADAQPDMLKEAKRQGKPLPEVILDKKYNYTLSDAVKRAYTPVPDSVQLLKTATGRANLDKIADQYLLDNKKLLDLDAGSLKKKLYYKPSSNKDCSCGMYAVDYMNKNGMLGEQARRELQEELKTGIPAPKHAPEEPKKEEQKETEVPAVQEEGPQLNMM